MVVKLVRDVTERVADQSTVTFYPSQILDEKMSAGWYAKDPFFALSVLNSSL